MATGAYSERFADDLADDVPRVPITIDAELFDEVCLLGEELLWLHTWGEQFHTGPQGPRPYRNLPTGSARSAVAVGSEPDTYPEEYSYDASTQVLRVGAGEFTGVSPEVWAFEVSGMRVIGSWLGYRMKVRAGKKSSELDKVRPARWNYTGELLTVMSVVEHTVGAEARGRELLDRVVAGAVLRDAAVGPVPSELRDVPDSLADDAEDEQLLTLDLD